MFESNLSTPTSLGWKPRVICQVGHTTDECCEMLVIIVPVINTSCEGAIENKKVMYDRVVKYRIPGPHNQPQH